MTYDENDPILKVQAFLNKRGWNIEKGDNDAYQDLQRAFKCILRYESKDNGFDKAILCLLNRGWGFGGIEGYQQFHKCVKLYFKLENKRLLKQLNALPKNY